MEVNDKENNENEVLKRKRNDKKNLEPNLIISMATWGSILGSIGKGRGKNPGRLSL